MSRTVVTSFLLALSAACAPTPTAPVPLAPARGGEETGSEDTGGGVDTGTDDTGGGSDTSDPLAPPIIAAADIEKFVTPLPVPAAMVPAGVADGFTYYEVAVRQIEQQVLPAGMPVTTLWAYGSPADGNFHSPSSTFEVRRDEPVRVKWTNGLIDGDGGYLPHLLPVDQTLHWANPGGPVDSMGMDPEPYTGPVPMVVHVHGAHAKDSSDGYPEAWWLPDATDIPAGYATEGTRYATEIETEPGSAVFEYANDQRASTLWYHDHTVGMTRLNVYAGPAGFWLVRDDEEAALDLPGPAPSLGDADDASWYEIPLAIQDRSFRDDGSLWYPDSRWYFDEYDGPSAPESEVSPIWNPEFFGNTIVVNGRTWPYLEVEPRLYRLRLLNGCGSRFLLLDFDDDTLAFTQIGSDGGLLSGAPVVKDQVLLGPAERADVLVDFSAFSPGDEITMLNFGPDAPFKGLENPDAPDPADPDSTGMVMQFRVVASTGAGRAGAVPTALPTIETLESDLPPRTLTLNEIMDDDADVPIQALLGTGFYGPRSWSDDITETPTEGDTEIWQIANLTEDAHPIHLHLVMFQVLDRQAFDKEGYMDQQEAWLEGTGEQPELADFAIGEATSPADNEVGWKDTVIAYPGEVTRLVARFDKAGLYVWHCHILEHEDNEMMRPFAVLEPTD